MNFNKGFSCKFHLQKAQIAKLQQQMEKERKEFDERLFKEQSSLREQLQVHIQTIGILVAEKTELQSSLSQCQQTAKQRAGMLFLNTNRRVDDTYIYTA